MQGRPNGGVLNSFNLNLYTYTYQNPVRLTDPDGSIAIADDIIIAALLIGMAFSATMAIKEGTEAIKNSRPSNSNNTEPEEKPDPKPGIPPGKTTKDDNSGGEGYIYVGVKDSKIVRVGMSIDRRSFKNRMAKYKADKNYKGVKFSIIMTVKDKNRDNRRSILRGLEHMYFHHYRIKTRK